MRRLLQSKSSFFDLLPRVVSFRILHSQKRTISFVLEEFENCTDVSKACDRLKNIEERGTPLLNQETSESGASYLRSTRLKQGIWMGRKMVKMAKITNEKTRITTYNKRKKCLYKKAGEFSTLCGVETCLIVYGPSRAGDEMVVEPELWPTDESKVRDIITKYRDTASSSCTKTYTVQECLEKSNTKVENPKNATKYHPWDKKLEKCSLNELYAVFMAVENKIQEATNRNQTFPDSTSWSNDQLGLCGYNQQCFEQYQLFPLPTMEHNGFSLFPFNNQMTSNTAEVASFSNVTEPMIANGQNLFYGSCSDGPYGPVVQRTAYMEPLQWGLGNSMFNNMKQFPDYPFRFAQVNDSDDSSKLPM